MNEETETKTAAAQAEILLNLSSHRRQQGEQLARHEFRELMSDLRSGDYLLALTTEPKPGPRAGWTVSATLRKAAYSGLPVLNVPLGGIAFASHPSQLPCIGLQLSDDQPDPLSRSLASFFSEHHRKPFCKPLFLSTRLDILPFLRRFGFAASANMTSWNEAEYELLQLRYGMDQVRDLASGTVLW